MSTVGSGALARTRPLRAHAGLLLSGLLAASACAAAAPSGAESALGEIEVPGYRVEVYATLADPAHLSFAPDGTLYAGRDNSGSGGSPLDAVRIHRVPPGGGAGVAVGSAIPDPDVVQVDVDGAITGTPGAVIVGADDGGQGALYVLWPDETVTGLHGPTSAYLNPGDMFLDADGRLGFCENVGKRIVAFDGLAPATYFSLSAAPTSIAMDPHDGRVYVATVDGRLTVHARDGNPLDDRLIEGLANVAPLAVDRPGSIFTPPPDDHGDDDDGDPNDGDGTPAGHQGPGDVYCVSGGALLRISPAGDVTSLGSGFGFTPDIAFGPDGALYLSDFDADRILRVTWVPGDVNGDATIDLADLSQLLAHFGTPSGATRYDGDLDADGDVDLSDLALLLAHFGEGP